MFAPQGRLNFRAVQIRWETEARGFHLVTTAYGSGRVPHVRPSVHGPKMDSSNAFATRETILAFGHSLSDRVTVAEEGAAPVLFGPCTLGRTWGTRPGRRTSLLAPTATPRWTCVGALSFLFVIRLVICNDNLLSSSGRQISSFNKISARSPRDPLTRTAPAELSAVLGWHAPLKSPAEPPLPAPACRGSLSNGDD
jgi:hypothetical protein